MDNLPQFRNQCSYCYRTTKSKIHFCCNIAICDFHLYLHPNHKPLYSVKFINEEYLIESEIFDDIEKLEISKWISNSDFDDNIEKIECKHDFNFNNDDENDLLDKNSCNYNLDNENNNSKKFNNDQNYKVQKNHNENEKNISKEPQLYLKKENNIVKCSQNACEITNNLYLCLQCGFIGCGRLQYGKNGNEHAKEHFKKTGHFKNVSLDSLTFDGRNNSYCYKCDSFIFNKNVREEIKKIGINFFDFLKRVKKENIKKDKEQIQDKNDKKFLGIQNAGNTCYISSFFHLLSLCLNQDFSSHFEICQNEPLNCYLCQFIKIITVLNQKYIKNEIYEDLISIDILDFINCLEKENLFFNRFMQQDVNEFMMLFFMKIMEHEILFEIQNFSSLFKLESKNTFECKNCNSKTEVLQEEMGIAVSCCKNIQESIDNFFNEESFECSCKGTKIKNVSVSKLPNYLFVTLKLFKYENDGTFIKILDKIDVCDRIKIKENNLVEYKLLGTILHRGKNTVTGHYVFKYENIIVDDAKIYEENNEEGCAYILLYKRIN